MDVAVEVAQWIALLAYLALAAVALRLWGRHRDPTSLWVLAASLALAAVAGSGVVLPEGIADNVVVTKLTVLLLLLFPYAVHRVGRSLADQPRWLRRVADVGAVALAAAALALTFPEDGEELSGPFGVFALGFLAYWTLMFTTFGIQLLRAGRDQPTLIRRRLRLLGVGAILMGLALLVSFFLGKLPTAGPWVTLVTTLLGGVSALSFALGFAPPAFLRAAWRAPEEQALQDAAVDLQAAGTRRDVTEILLPHVAAMIGASGVVLLDDAGSIVARHGAPIDLDHDDDPGRLRARLRHGELVADTSSYTPFFGADEQRIVGRLAVLADLALERVSLLDDLRDANRALNEVNDDLEAFVYSASHDLKNPLIAMLGYLDILKVDYGDVLDEQGQWYLERMTTNGAFMESLIGDLLELSRVGRVAVDAEDLDLGPVLDEIRDDVASRHPAVQVEVGAMPRVHMNATRARQLFANLVENAAKYGGRPDVRIEVTAEHLDHTCRIVVADDGVGIPDDYREQVFGVFERLEADDSKSQGTGIGLAICRKIVESVGGRIWLHESDRGADFRIRFPSEIVRERPVPDRPQEVPA